MIRCEICGALVEKRGLPAHQKLSMKCKALRNVKEAERRGLKKAGHIARYLKELDIPFVKIASSVEYRGHHLAYYESIFAPGWIVDRYKELRKKYSVKQTIQMLRKEIEVEKWRCLLSFHYK